MKRIRYFILAAGILCAFSCSGATAVLQIWAQRFNGPANGADNAVAMAVDTNGNVFVTGDSVGSGGSSDYVTLKYSGAGVPLWTNRYDGPAGGIDVPTAMILDSTGNVFVTGYSIGPNGSYDYATVGYSNSGALLWVNRYDGPTNGDDYASAICVGTNGSVIVTGFSNGGGSVADYATIAYSNSGVPLWTNRFNGSGNDLDSATAIAADTNGNVFVTGASFLTANNYDYATIKYSSMGVPLWTNRYNRTGNNDDEPNAIVVNNGGTVFVTGFSMGPSGNSYDFATIAYSNVGVPLWTNRFNGPGSGDDEATAIAVYSTNVFVTGFSVSTNGYPDYDYVTIKYSSAGVPQWTNRYNGPVTNDDEARAIAVDGSGNVIVTGYSAGSSVTPFNYDCATVAYSNAGLPLWTNRYNGPANQTDYSAAVEADSLGNVFIAGHSFNGTNTDFVTVEYSTVNVAQPIPLSMQMSGGLMVLSWNNPAFVLQSSPAIGGSFTNILAATSPYTNPVSGAQQFFRLRAN